MTLQEMRDVIEQAAGSVGGGNRAFLEHSIRALKKVRSAANSQQIGATGAMKDLLIALHGEASRVNALVVDSYNATDRHEADSFIKAMVVVLREAVGEDQRKEWFERAAVVMKERQDATVSRRMEAGNAITLGSSGGPKQRRSS